MGTSGSGPRPVSSDSTAWSFTAFDRNSDPVLRGTNVTTLFEDRSGALWIGTDEGSVIRGRAGGFEDIATNRLRGP